MFGKIGTSECYLLNFSRGSFEEISLIQSCRELNDISFKIRSKSLKMRHSKDTKRFGSSGALVNIT